MALPSLLLHLHPLHMVTLLFQSPQHYHTIYLSLQSPSNLPFSFFSFFFFYKWTYLRLEPPALQHSGLRAYLHLHLTTNESAENSMIILNANTY